MRIVFALIVVFAASAANAFEGVVPYEVDGKKYEGYHVSSWPAAPLIFLVHDWDGITDYEIKRARMLSKLGYSVFAVDMFGAGVRPTEISDKKELTSALYEDRDKMRRLLRGGVKIAESKGEDLSHAVAIGYCFGGSVVLELARSGQDMKGFVSFHGGLTTPDFQSYTETRGKVMVFHGTADQVASMDDFAQLAKELELNSVPHEMITYSGAPHAFTVFDSPRYREDADKKSWTRFTEFLQEVLN